MLFRNTAIIISILLISQVVAQKKQLTLEVLYHPKKKHNFNGSIPKITWLPDGKYYMEKIKNKKKKTLFYKVEALTGKKEPLFDAQKMAKAFIAIPGISKKSAHKLAGRSSYHFNHTYSAILLNYSNDLFYYKLQSANVIRLTNTLDKEKEPHFSPNNQFVSFVRNNDLYVVHIATRQERRLTRDGSANIFNGCLDWVYQEEIYGRGNFQGHWWSPDSTRIAYLKLDESPVKKFTVVDHIPYRLNLEVTSYPKAGDPNPKVSLGVVHVVGGATKWIDNSRYQAMEFLIVDVKWLPDNSRVSYQVQNREQTWLDLNLANPDKGSSKNIIRETSKAWVNANGSPYWLEKGEFLWLSERTGFKHIYHYKANGKLLRQVTSGSWEVRSLHGVNKKNKTIYFSSTHHSPIAPHTYHCHLDGTEMARLTTPEGSHRSLFNSKATFFINYWSNFNTPTQTNLYTVDGAKVRSISQNPAKKHLEYKLGQTQFLQVKTRDGFVMEAMMIKPPGFTPNRKYPVFCYNYSGPHAQSVRNRWGGKRYLWHQMLAQKGYIIWICDNRTASGKGVQSSWQGYRNFGDLELRDLEDSLGWLKKQPYVDSSRIGIWGWSYGGYMVCYALTHSKSFKIGIAGAPVTDWRNYDSIYTERYMGRPQNNPTGYKKSSPVHAAKNLYGKLLLIHGTMDDNVHLQNAIQFCYALQKANKQFQFMAYPKSRHGVRDKHLSRHLYTLMTNFILENL